MTFITDLSNSLYDFRRVVWPEVRGLIGGGELISVEGNATDTLCKNLDVLAGIDGWQVRHDHGMRGIGSRVQWITPNGRRYDTFTIRRSRGNGRETEFLKRLRAIQGHQGWLFPHLTIQAYVEKPERVGPLLSVAVCLTEELILYVDEHKRNLKVNSNFDGSSDFYVVPWDQYAAAGKVIEVLAKQHSL